MFTLGPAVQQTNQRIEIEIGEAKFGLTLRPVTDDERLFDSSLRDRYWQDADPEIVGKIGVARAKGLLKLVVGWDGIFDPAGNPVPFSREALATLVADRKAGGRVSVELARYFDDGGAGQREKGEPSGSDTLRPESSAGIGSNAKTSPSPLNGTVDDSEQVNLQTV